MRDKIDKLNKEIQQIKLKSNALNNNNNEIENRVNQNKIIFNGIDEIIQEINNNHKELDKNESDENTNINAKEDIDKRKDIRKGDNLANFVFDFNNDLNEIKDNNEKDFAI